VTNEHNLQEFGSRLWCGRPQHRLVFPHRLASARGILWGASVAYILVQFYLSEISPESPVPPQNPVTTLALGLVALWGFLRWNAAQGAENTAVIQSAQQALRWGTLPGSAGRLSQ